MDRNWHKKFIPPCKRTIPIVSQYLWEDKDTNTYMCTNGISHPIYDCKGWVNYSLPLEMYPPANEVHPQIEMVRRMHLNWRGNPTKLVKLEKKRHYPAGMEGFQNDNGTEGFYSGRQHPNPYYPNEDYSCGSCG